MKTMMKWSEATTLEFVKIYLKHECLWNSTHPAYTLKYKREKAYAAIIQEFRDFSGKNMSLPEVKTKIKNLRSTYSQEVHKIIQKSSPGSMYEPTLAWFQDMDRCLKHVSFKRSSQSVNYFSDVNEEIPGADSTSHTRWADEQDQDLHDSSFEDANPDPLVSQTITSVDYGIDVPDQTLSIVKIEPSIGHNKRMKKKKLKYKPKQAYNTKTEKTRKDDEFDIYGKFIATQLRKMELNRALRIQLAIQSLLSEARLSEYS